MKFPGPRGYFGIGIYHLKFEGNLGGLWRSAHALGADFIFTVGARYKWQGSDTTKAWNHVPFFEFSSMDDLRDHLPHGCRIVGVELDPRARPLSTYVHPERACYLLGAEDYGLHGKQLAYCNDVVVVEHATFCLNVATAGSIVLHDRRQKAARP